MARSRRGPLDRPPRTGPQQLSGRAGPVDQGPGRRAPYLRPPAEPDHPGWRPDYGDLGRAFPPWPRPGMDAILHPPKPEIPPSLRVLQRAADRDADWEAAD